ncbi:alpha/beta hydrolase fold [Singulisphaera sp. GP187]|uniref:alpha/beta hydrolase n=1 Tax=Singulisphaera sp. GP187 TaxID=1882752 RepID=UPI0009296EE2|nr:alpha/beta hydrolase [Singulisphaera sp. GP187]SIO66458.1 alpha/beta hydrolase fold [Singulisphaera sp. GP187]
MGRIDLIGRWVVVIMAPLSWQQAMAQNGRPRPDVAEARYGHHDYNTLDLWKAKSASGSRTPLVVYIHGGGFQGGDKKEIPEALLAECLGSGISVASINYRLTDVARFPAPMHDGARAIQFLRSESDRWGLDPNRFAASGSSAGAGIALWVGFHDDLADPNADDPVARKSTRLSCIGVVRAQTSYDPRFIKKRIGGRAHEHPALRPFFGLKPNESLGSPHLYPLYERASAINYATPDDPPVFLYYQDSKVPLTDNDEPGRGIHHRNFGVALREVLEPLGVECIIRHRGDYRDGEAVPKAVNHEMVDFFRKRFLLSIGDAKPVDIPGHGKLNSRLPRVDR